MVYSRLSAGVEDITIGAIAGIHAQLRFGPVRGGGEVILKSVEIYEGGSTVAQSTEIAQTGARMAICNGICRSGGGRKPIAASGSRWSKCSYAEAKAILLELERWLRRLNESAADSLREAFEELLTLQRLKGPALLRQTLHSASRMSILTRIFPLDG